MTQPTSLFNKNFFLLWRGQFVSQMGNQAFSIAMMFWIKHETGWATLMGLVMMVSQIPAVLLDQNIPLIYVICRGPTTLLSVLASRGRDFQEFLAYHLRIDPK